MFQRFVFLALMFVSIAPCGGAPLAAGEYPAYRVLQTPPGGPHGISRGNNTGVAQRVSTPAFSYGYFGVQPRKHPARHRGYYNNYLEWSWR